MCAVDRRGQPEFQKYLLSFNKVPVCLKEIVGNFREWHLQKIGCMPEDFLGRMQRAMEPSVEKHENKLYDLTEDTLGFEEVDRIHFSSRKSTRAETNDILGGDEQVIVEEDDHGVSIVTVSREIACLAVESCKFQTLTTTDLESLGYFEVTVLTEHRMKGRSPYAEYQFISKCGTRRRLSARDKMSIKVKQLVKDYEDWHVSNIGAYSTDHIAEQHEYAASDDEAQDLEDWQEPLILSCGKS